MFDRERVDDPKEDVLEVALTRVIESVDRCVERNERIAAVVDRLSSRWLGDDARPRLSVIRGGRDDG